MSWSLNASGGARGTTPERWSLTSSGAPRGYIDFEGLKELWFHTGTRCNLRCPDCFEHAGPGADRLDAVSLADVRPYMEEAAALGVRQFSVTGGEPFLNPEIIPILDRGLDLAPCLVLSNGTRPLLDRLADLQPLARKRHALSFRISLDYPDAAKHDAARGAGMFSLALASLGRLHRAGFHVSVARRRTEGEREGETDAAYRSLFETNGLPALTSLVSFPELGKRGTPEITETCMRTHHSPRTCSAFMCAFSRMAVKQNGRMRVCACTLVDDDPQYDFGSALSDSLRVRTMLKHPRCITCFAGGTSCSEL
jgi:sulfatase maturation enzyme AslB (radical SAM superfamily)